MKTKLMSNDELFKWLDTCPSQDWFVADADTEGVRIYFPCSMVNEVDYTNIRKVYDPTPHSWITNEELEIAHSLALPIFDDFYQNEGEGEESWTEIEVDGNVFDINCWDEGSGDGYDLREGAVHCVVHRTYINDNGWRECDGENFYRLFTVDINLSEEGA